MGTAKYGALEIAFKKFAGELGPDSLGEIRNRGRRSGRHKKSRRAAGARNFCAPARARGHGLPEHTRTPRTLPDPAPHELHDATGSSSSYHSTAPYTD